MSLKRAYDCDGSAERYCMVNAWSCERLNVSKQHIKAKFVILQNESYYRKHLKVELFFGKSRSLQRRHTKAM